MSLDLLYTDVEESLRGVVRELLADRCPARLVTGCYDGDRGLAAPLWRALAFDLGLAGLLIPEHLGGAGASPREAATVLEELGRSLAPVPFLTSAVVGTSTLQAAGTPEAWDLLAPLASGQSAVALVSPFSSITPRSTVQAASDGTVRGKVTGVVGAIEADVLLVPVVGGDVHAVPAGLAQVTPVTSLDMTRQIADVTFTAASGTIVARGEAGIAAVSAGLQMGAALLASEQIGVAQWCLHETVRYLGQRRQFGRIVGGFQAVKHRLADLYVEVEMARAAARYAAATQASADPDSVIAATIAQVYCSDIAVRAAEEALQLHGGIGMTWEHPMHLYLKRAKADQIGYGTPGRHLDRLAELVDLPGPR